MKLTVKSMWIDSASTSLENYLPEDPSCFGLWVEFRAGFVNTAGADDFRLFVCTPEWLKKECCRNKVIWGRHMLIVSRYDLDAMAAEIALCVENCAGDDWNAIAGTIARFAAWEFEDYHM
jgi:hypothetical protein